MGRVVGGWSWGGILTLTFALYLVKLKNVFVILNTLHLKWERASLFSSWGCCAGKPTQTGFYYILMAQQMLPGSGVGKVRDCQTLRLPLSCKAKLYLLTVGSGLSQAKL